MRLIILLCCLAWSSGLTAQTKEFEGKIISSVSIRSKAEGVEDRQWYTILAMGETSTSYVKQGNYKIVTSRAEQYYLPAEQRLYIKFRALDTLYYIDYASDTSTVLGFSKTGSGKAIAGYACNPITIKTADSEKKYFYAPALYLDPEHDKNNSINQMNLRTRETSAVWLELTEETINYQLTQTCTRLVAEPVSDNVFTLPGLPQKKFSPATMGEPAVFKRAGGWNKYLETNINGSLGSRYVKLPKGETVAQETVQVRFMVDERGMVQHAEALNKKEVHSKLVEEALRVVSSSPPWTPAKLYGEKVIYWMKQGITFQVSK